MTDIERIEELVCELIADARQAEFNDIDPDLVAGKREREWAENELIKTKNKLMAAIKEAIDGKQT